MTSMQVEAAAQKQAQRHRAEVEASRKLIACKASHTFDLLKGRQK